MFCTIDGKSLSESLGSGVQAVYEDLDHSIEIVVYTWRGNVFRAPFGRYLAALEIIPGKVQAQIYKVSQLPLHLSF